MKDEERWQELSIWMNNPQIGLRYASMERTDDGRWVHILSPAEKLDLQHRNFWFTIIGALLFIVVSMLL